MVLKAERERVKALLTEAITVLCKNGLGYKYTCAIEGLLGITLDDDDVFLVNINESIQKAERPPPVEETTKQETGTHSPASSSPSNTPRRRRRRSQEGEGGQSPAKRANYGAEQDHSRIKPQSREDVIVIKEEVSETEFSDFYGDTGGGENEDSGQYVMQQGDQQYPGAGCSQWDTSQTQGGQSDWPAFNPTQQQQAAISQAASSAMMSPSQISRVESLQSVRSAPTLQSKKIKDIVSQLLVRPLMSCQRKLLAFRLSWIHDTDDTFLRSAWENILPNQARFDQSLLAMPGVQGFASAVTATSVFKTSKENPSVKYWRTYPGIACFLMCHESFIERVLCDSAKAVFPSSTLKFLLQPFQMEEKGIMAAFCNVLKENSDCAVRRQLCEGYSESMNKPIDQSTFSLVHFTAGVEPFISILRGAAGELSSAGFPIEYHHQM